MPRFQPPMIVGGTRDAPQWSDLGSYYLPTQEGLLPPVGYTPGSAPPRPSIGEQYRQLYHSMPIEQSPPRYQRPAPWTSQEGPSAYDEIMSRLRTPIQSSAPETPTATEPQSTAPQSSGGTWEGLSDYGLPEGWQNGDPGNGAARAMIAHRQAMAEQQAAQERGLGESMMMSEAGYGEGTGTRQSVDIYAGGGGAAGSYGLGVMGGTGPYDPFNTSGTGVSARVGATDRQDWDPNQGWTAVNAGRPKEPIDWETAALWARAAAGDITAVIELSNRRRNNSDTNRESASDREANTNE